MMFLASVVVAKKMKACLKPLESSLNHRKSSNIGYPWGRKAFWIPNVKSTHSSPFLHSAVEAPECGLGRAEAKVHGNVLTDKHLGATPAYQTWLGSAYAIVPIHKHTHTHTRTHILLVYLKKGPCTRFINYVEQKDGWTQIIAKSSFQSAVPIAFNKWNAQMIFIYFYLVSLDLDSNN